MVDCGPNCQETLREIEHYLDGEVASDVKHRIEDHLADCTPCMGRADFRKHVKQLVHAKCAEDEVPSELQRRIESLIASLDAASGA